MLTWDADDSFDLGDTTFVCRPMGHRFESEPGRFCLLKKRPDVEWYERLVREREPRSIVEVGSYDGASSAFLAEIARPARVVAIDVRPEPTSALTDFITRRGLAGALTPHYGVDQSDTARLREIVDDAFGATSFDGGALDLVIDDASHLVDPTRATFNCLFPRLREGGLYVIEDWAWAHSAFAARGAWADQRPLTALVFELVLACGSHPRYISSVNVTLDYTVVERGPAPIDRDAFDLTKCFGPRGAALIAD